jgi:hypothetical protein
VSGTISSASQLLTQFASGQPEFSIIPAYVQNFIASVQAGTLQTVRTVTAAGTITMVASDSVIAVAQASPAAVTVNLANAPVTNQRVTIKDVNGVCATNPITVVPNAGNIDGAANFVMNTNYASVVLQFFGTNWGII